MMTNRRVVAPAATPGPPARQALWGGAPGRGVGILGEVSAKIVLGVGPQRRWKNVLVLAAVAAFVVSGSAQTPAPILQEPQTIPLWPNGAPGAAGHAPEDTPTL